MLDLNRYLMTEIALQSDFDAYTVHGIEGPLSPRRLDKLGKINIFVGANNAGKSRLIRNLAKAQEYIFEPPDEARPLGLRFRELSSITNKLFGRLNQPHLERDQLISRLGIQEPSAWFGKLNLSGLVSRPKAERSRLEPIPNVLEKIKESGRRPAKQLGIAAFDEEIDAAIKKIQLASEYERSSQGIQRLYIPTLRTLRDLKDKALLGTRTSEDYKIDKDIVFTGQSLYEDVERLLRGNLRDRETLRDFEIWISESFFEGKPVALIPKLQQTTLTVKIGEEQEKPIHELGDGIQSLLILTFPLFQKKDAHLIAFIEEPELFLHPWLQRVFLEMLSSRFSKHQYFFTTHSNHFLDLTLDLPDVSVFTVEKEINEAHSHKEKPAHFNVRQVSHDDRKPLELLGVRNSSVFLSNCTIWVEGITDRRYIAHWLSLYQKLSQGSGGPTRQFKEDLHYSFVEYGGGNITHFSFLDDEADATGPEAKSILVDRLCGKLFLITDADGDKKKERKQKLEARLDDRYFCLPGREIENLIKPEVLQRILVCYGEHEPPLFTHVTYLKAQLGKFIDTKLGDYRKRRSAYSDEYGVLKGKVRFCEKAVVETKAWEDVSAEAQNLIKRLYIFIEKMNPH